MVNFSFGEACSPLPNHPKPSGKEVFRLTKFKDLPP
jgi:hypothetical protein